MQEVATSLYSISQDSIPLPELGENPASGFPAPCSAPSGTTSIPELRKNPGILAPPSSTPTPFPELEENTGTWASRPPTVTSQTTDPSQNRAQASRLPAPPLQSLRPYFHPKPGRKPRHPAPLAPPPPSCTFLQLLHQQQQLLCLGPQVFEQWKKKKTHWMRLASRRPIATLCGLYLLHRKVGGRMGWGGCK